MGVVTATAKKGTSSLTGRSTACVWFAIARPRSGGALHANNPSVLSVSGLITSRVASRQVPAPFVANGPREMIQCVSAQVARRAFARSTRTTIARATKRRHGLTMWSERGRHSKSQTVPGKIGPRDGAPQPDHQTGNTGAKRESRISGKSRPTTDEMWLGRANQSEPGRTFGSRVVAVMHRSTRTRIRATLGCRSFRLLAKETTLDRGTKRNGSRSSERGWRRHVPRVMSIPLIR